MMNKISRMILSLVVAFGLWWYVINTVSPGFSDIVSNIPVVLEGEANLIERGLMVTDVSNDAVSLRLYGNRSDMIKINQNNTVVRVDLSKVTDPGRQVVGFTPVFPSEVGNGSVTLEEGIPGTVTLTISNRVTKQIPVDVKWIGSAKEGFITDRENRVLDNPVISISGPEETVSLIEKAMIDVDLTDQTASISDYFRYTLCDEAGEPVDAQGVTTNVEQIRLDVRIQQVRDVTLTYKLVEGGGAKEENVVITLSIPTIRVAGSEAALDALGDEINVGTINLGELPKGTSMVFPITMPEGVTNLTGAAEVTAEVKFTGLAVKEFVLSDIQHINKPDGMKADVITASLTVAVRGPSDLIAKLTAKNITVTVDLSGAELGTSTYKASCQLSEGFEDVGVLRADPISVSLTEE